MKNHRFASALLLSLLVLHSANAGEKPRRGLFRSAPVAQNQVVQTQYVSSQELIFLPDYSINIISVAVYNSYNLIRYI